MSPVYYFSVKYTLLYCSDLLGSTSAYDVRTYISVNGSMFGFTAGRVKIMDGAMENDYRAATGRDRNSESGTRFRGPIFQVVSAPHGPRGKWILVARGRPRITTPEMNILSLTLHNAIVVIANTSGRRAPNRIALQSITTASCHTPYIMQHVECPVK